MHNSSFNIVQLALIGLLTVACICLVVACGPSKQDKMLQSMTQLRGIHQSMVVYGSNNKDCYPGLHYSDGLVAASVEDRYKLLLDNDLIEPEYLVSPFDSGSSITVWDGSSSFSSKHYSFTMLQLPDEGQRLAEWRVTLNSQAVVMSDRNTGTKDAPTSLYGGSAWNGAVLWNDNHVSYQESDTVEAKYGHIELNPSDRLFESDGPDDALMVHTGN